MNGQEGKVCKLQKALYGLKQAPRARYEKIHAYLIGQGFQNSPTKSTLYVKIENESITMLTIFVDEILVTTNDVDKIAHLKML